MASASREKGKRGERMVAELLRGMGIGAKRSVQHCGDAGDADIIAASLPDCFIEAKNVARCGVDKWLAKARSQANGKVPLVFAHRTHSRAWTLTIDASDLVRLSRMVADAVEEPK